MIKKMMPVIIIALVFIFPFRWAFLEYPKPVSVDGTMVDSGSVQYMLYFLLTVIGFLVFMFMSIKSGDEKAKEQSH